MIGVEATITDPGILEAYAEVAETFPDFVNKSTNATANRIGPEIIKDLQKEPPPVKTPIAWSSAKQRRYVMMLKRKGLIPSPYIRTHGVSQGWKMSIIYTPGELTSIQINNDDSATPYVEGRNQQGYHKTTGWLNAADTVAPWIEVLTDEIETDVIKALYLVEGKK